MSVKYPMLGAEECSSVVKCSPSTCVSPQFDSQHHKWEEVSCFNGNTESILTAYAAVGRG